MRNILWTGTGPYRGPKETVTYPVNSGFVKWVIHTKEEIEAMRRTQDANANVVDVPEADPNAEIITLSDSTSDSE